jgi:hypothetical protein
MPPPPSSRDQRSTSNDVPRIEVVQRPGNSKLQGLDEPLHAVRHRKIIAWVLAQRFKTVEIIGHG